MRGAKIPEIRVFGWIGVILIAFCSMGTVGQNANSLKLLDFKYGFHIPSGDMSERFGSNSDLGIGIHTVRIDQKLMFGIEGSLFFGNTVKEDVLASLRTFDGGIIGIDGKSGDVYLKERGFYLGLNTGKIFSTSVHKNKLTGIRAQIGFGLLQHKIRVQDNSRSIVALEKKYLNGYDRLSNGPALHIGLGYHYQSPTNNLHFYIMSDLYASQTTSRRDIDYLTGEYLEQKRTDLLAGLNIGYVVIISRVNKPEHIYY